MTADIPDTAGSHPPRSTLENLLAAGNAALLAGDWPEARASFEAALRERDVAEAHDGLSEALFWLNQLEDALRHREHAYVEFRRRGELCRAARAAMWLGQMYYLIHANSAAFNGWMVRAERLLGESGPCAEHGWLEVFRRAGESDPAVVAQSVGKAIAIAREYGDADLENVALAYGGLALVTSGRVGEGMSQLDEAMAAATSGEVRSFSAIGIIYCVLLTACDRAADFERAEDWCRVMDGFIRRQYTTSFSATCRTFYGSVLAATGRWSEAEEVLCGALRTFDEGCPAMRVDALVRLSELRIRQGRFDEAYQLLEGYEEHPEASWPVAALCLLRGEVALAEALLQRRLRQLGSETTLQAVPLLTLLVDVQLVRSNVSDARDTVSRLATMARSSMSKAIAGVVELAMARVSAAADEDPVPHLEAALDYFSHAEMPLELAQTRLALAQALVGRNMEVAASEARSALATFERLGATRGADAAAQLLRQFGAGARTGPKAYGVLSKREQEVLRLLGLGFSNHQIADTLYISRRTAEHHVSSILSKLGLTTRAEAAAYAVRHGTVVKSVSD